jgi:NADH-quinone oxidoreductase subunit N
MPVTTAPSIEWGSISPILILCGGSLLILLWGAFDRAIERWKLTVAAMIVLGAAGASLVPMIGETRLAMGDMVVIDGVGLFTSMIILVSAFVVLPVSQRYLHARRIHRTEFEPLLLFATAGMLLLATANDLLMVFIAIEVLSLALYVMVAIAKRDAGAQEAALKYFLLGAFSSAILLYGVAMLYGATASTRIPEIANAVANGAADVRLLLTGFTLLVVGLAFKVGAAPFHMWTPDVYQGAPTNVTAFMAAGTKAAAFAALLRVALVSFGSFAWDWRPALWAIAIVTMVVGSLVAIAQTDVKRMLGYSSVAHAGFIMIGVVAADRAGVAGVLFYLLVYAVMTIGAFTAVMVSGREGRERLDLVSWSGLGRREPLFAAVMTLFLLSLAGIPPTGGFIAKLVIFTAAQSAGETGLVIVGAIASVVAAFFYLRLIVVMWLHEPSGEVAPSGIDVVGGWTLGIAAAFIAVVGVWPQELLDLARRAAELAG